MAHYTTYLSTLLLTGLPDIDYGLYTAAPSALGSRPTTHAANCLLLSTKSTNSKKLFLYLRSCVVLLTVWIPKCAS